MAIWTVGHSNRTTEELVAALRAHGISLLWDVRAYPRSKRHPHFSREALSDELPRHGIGYAWRGKELGGYRGDPPAGHPHAALEGGFAAYAEYTRTQTFRAAMPKGLRRRVRIGLRCGGVPYGQVLLDLGPGCFGQNVAATDVVHWTIRTDSNQI